MSNENEREYLTTEPGTQMRIDNQGEVTFREEGEEEYPHVLEFPNLKFPGQRLFGASTGYKVEEGEVYDIEKDAPFNVIQNVRLLDEGRKPVSFRRMIFWALFLFLLYTIGQMVGTAWLVHVM